VCLRRPQALLRFACRRCAAIPSVVRLDALRIADGRCDLSFCEPDGAVTPILAPFTCLDRELPPDEVLIRNRASHACG
jgi:hypothetical protein